VSDSTNLRHVLHKIQEDDESPTRVERPSTPLDQVAARYNLKEALEACKAMRTNATPRKTAQQKDILVAVHPINGEDFEHDFTTRNGTPSNLDCPFAKVANGNTPKLMADPIAAEFHGDGSVISGTAYAQDNPNKCPIRYLDQHSPEEVTKYFENHKHEIPRSHAICISRYQQNDAKIRQLDAKYGNLQNMIQSLGVKHQQFLPAKEVVKDGEEFARRGSSPPAAVAVEKWAENVSRRSDDAAAPPIQPRANGVENRQRQQEERTQHFERPLREIRLGESPSRPWGISVPLAQETAASAIPSDKGIEPLSLNKTEQDSTAAAEGQRKEEKPTGRCPFGHSSGKQELRNGASHEKATTVKEDRVNEPHPHPYPQMTFNGPVFFGYSPEQATALMQSGAFGSGKT
jgi:hypothetical protein